MKKRFIAALLVSVATVACMNVGCEKKTVSDNDSAVITETASIPDEVKEKLAAAANMESVPVPDNGWTDEALLDTVRINGEKVEFPFTLNDLGDAFAPIKDDFQNLNAKGIGMSNFEYYHKKAGLIYTYSTSDLNNISNDAIQQFTIKIENDEAIKGNLPLSINGITIGSDYDEINEKLGFIASEDNVPNSYNDGKFSLQGRAENFLISISGKHKKVDRLSIGYYEKNKKEGE